MSLPTMSAGPCGSGGAVAAIPPVTPTFSWGPPDAKFQEPAQSTSSDDTDPVGSWVDNVSNDDLDQGTAAAKPTLSTGDGPNSLDHLVLDGGDYLSTSGNSGLTGDIDVEVLSIINVDAGISGWDRWFQIGSGAAAEFYGGMDGSGNWTIAFNGSWVTFGAYTTGSWLAVHCKKVPGASTSTNTRLWVDGSEKSGTSNGSGATPNVTATAFHVGANGGGPASHFDGLIAGVYVWDGGLTDGQRTDVFSWVSNYYGLG